VKTGYTFDGWFVGSEEWNFANDIESDLELEAKFTPLTYRLTVPVNQSEFTVNVTSANPVEYGGSFTFDIIASEGYDVSDMMVYANGVLLEKDSENGNTVSFSVTNITEAKVITVRGIGQNTYAVTYRANTTDYVGNMPENVIKAYDNNIAVSDLVPERYGYDFIGWSTAENGTAQYNAGDIYSENSDLTLYAVWKAKTFTVSFETRGGNINSGEITEYTYGTGTVLPTDVTKEGYDFAGWYEDELLQGVRVYEIKASDYGNKKYYAAYSIADVPVNDYIGEYDGNAHNITYALTDNLSVEKYQWYFVPEGASNATAVQSDSYNSYAVKDVADSGEYYCYIEALIDEYVIRFFTERATVKITKKPVSVKAADSSKVYDAQPLAENGIELTDESSLAENHTISAVMTADSTITKVGTQTNVIDLVTILDIDGKNVTENYEITKQNGTLSVTPLTLTVDAENLNISTGSVLNENSLYKISGMLGDEKLSLANTSVTAKNANGEDIAFADITKNTGAYTVIITYDGFDGDGSENYQGSGTITSEVTVYKRSSGGNSGGGSTSTDYTVKFDTDGGSEIASQTVKVNGTASEPKTPEKEGYIFDGWYTDGSLTEEFDFATKLTKSITLYAKWTEKEPDKPMQPVEPTTPEWKNPFADVKEDYWYYEDVEYAVDNGFMRGTSNTTFAPDGIITRAMMVTVLYRAEGEPAINKNIPFADIDMNAYYANAVVWAQQNGIVNGVSETEFAPND
ncbi:MAG: InlB B-repeat-containing protein, partial [Clostridia bacterium]|nr:InlB B-repeat-containing protein [Clostridia bacterium]